MTYKYFNNVKTVQEARIRYIQLSKEYHPDKNSDLVEKECNEITAEIGNEYKLLLNELEKEKEAPEPTINRPEKPNPHKSSVSGFYSIQEGKTRLKPKKKKTITRKQVKRGVDLFFDGLKWFEDLKK